MKKEDIKARYIEMQMLMQQIKQAEQQVQQLDLQMEELRKVIEDLDEIKKTPKGTEIFIPVSAGIFAKAKIEDAQSLLINVGANVAVEKSVEESKTLIESQIKEIAILRAEMFEQLTTLDSQASSIEEEIIKSKVDEEN